MVRPELGSVREKNTAESMQVQDSSKRLENCRNLQPVSIAPGYRIAKRLTDIVGSACLLLLLAPVFVILSVLVKLSSKGSIFYKSTRIGLLGEPFAFIKFRSMKPDADKLLGDLQKQNEKDGPIFKIKDDPRVTKIGKILRRFSLDELPQIYSVLTGEMSLVGPRPPLPHEVLQYDEACLERLRVKPGITCYWQVMGRSRLSFEEWMELDRRYVREMNYWLDIKLLLKTPKAVIKSDGAY